VAGGVDDVDLDAAPAKARILGQDGDAALAFEVARVHDPLGDLLVVAESAALPQHEVHERGLAVVDVGDDGDVTDVRTWHRRARLARGRPSSHFRSLFQRQPILGRIPLPIA